MKPLSRIYVDTSVIGGCLDPEFQKWSKQLIKEFHLGIFRLVVSSLTEAEINRAPDEIQRVYLDILESGAEFIEITPEAVELAEKYLKHKIIPANYRNDAIHIALATINQVDILVSWNFQHIVHYDKIRLFNAVNLECGYKPIEIFSPREVVSYEN